VACGLPLAAAHRQQLTAELVAKLLDRYCRQVSIRRRRSSISMFVDLMFACWLVRICSFILSSSPRQEFDGLRSSLKQPASSVNRTLAIVRHTFCLFDNLDSNLSFVVSLCALSHHAARHDTIGIADHPVVVDHVIATVVTVVVVVGGIDNGQ
jgi:hypothetical protein